MPPILGRAINRVFQKLERYDAVCQDRFASWFSYHLANFGFKWPWKNWVSLEILFDAFSFVNRPLTRAFSGGHSGGARQRRESHFLARRFGAVRALGLLGPRPQGDP
jgi:hypothetical protein